MASAYLPVEADAVTFVQKVDVNADCQPYKVLESECARNVVDGRAEKDVTEFMAE